MKKDKKKNFKYNPENFWIKKTKMFRKKTRQMQLDQLQKWMICNWKKILNQIVRALKRSLRPLGLLNRLNRIKRKRERKEKRTKLMLNKFLIMIRHKAGKLNSNKIKNFQDNLIVNRNTAKDFYTISQHVKIYMLIQMMIARMRELKSIKSEDIIQFI